MTALSAPPEAEPCELRRLGRDMLEVYARARGGGALRPGTIALPGGDAIQMDGVSEDESLIVEIVPHADASTEGVPARIAQALLGLSLVHRARPDAELVLLVANDGVRRAAAGWVAALDPHHHVRLATPTG